MTCNDCDDLLLEYAYDELAAGPRREVETHLPGCERCKGALAELKGTLLAVRTLPVEEPSAAGLESLLAFAGTAARRHREQAAPRAAGLLPPWLSTLLFKPGFAVAAVLLVVGVVSLKLSGAISFGGGSQAPGAGDRVHEAAPSPAAAAAPRAAPAFAKEEQKAAPEAPVAATPPAPPADRSVAAPAVEAVLAAAPGASRERAGDDAGSRTTGAGRKSGGGGELQESERFSKSRGSFAESPAAAPRPVAKADAHEPSTAGPAGKAEVHGGSATLDAPAPTASAQTAAAPKSAVGGAVGSFRDDGTGSEQDELAGVGEGAPAGAYAAPIARKSAELAKDAGDPNAALDQAEALFREAERLSAAARHAEAVKLFLRVAREYPSTLRARQALYAAWLLELDRGNTAAAGSLLAELARRYPGSQELQRARSREAKHVEEELARQPARTKKDAGPPKQPGRDLADDQAPADAASAPAESPAEPATQQAR